MTAITLVTDDDKRVLLGDDFSTDAVYLTDERKLVEVRDVDDKGRVHVHNCASSDETSTFVLLAEEIVGWRLIYPVQDDDGT